MKNPILVPELRDHLAHHNFQAIREFCQSEHPVEVAEFLSAMPTHEIWRILSLLEISLRVDIFSHLDEDRQVDLADTLRRRDLAALVTEMPPDDRVDLLRRMPEDRREAVLPALAQAERDDIRRLSSYPEGSAGAVMTSDYAMLSPELTVKEAIEKLRQEAPDKETIYYAYVVDQARRLIGFVSLRDLIVAPSNRRIHEIMHQNVIFAHAKDDQEEAARTIQKYDLIALPVINGNDALVGIITHDDALDIITQEHTEDMEKLMAISGSHEAGAYIRTSSWDHFKNRCGWILFLAVLGLVSGFIVQNFEGMLVQFAILASFMPMLADTGGNTGSQAGTLVVRALAMKEITPRDILKVVFKEFKVALPLGLLLAILAFGRVALFANDANIPAGFTLINVGVAVSIALGLQVVTSTLIGAILPMAVAKAGLDPAVVASPALTTIVDITGLLLYFSIAKILLGI